VPSLDSWKALETPAGADLLARCSELELRHPAHLARLRCDYDADVVAAAVELTLARRAARTKFPDLSGSLWADRVGLEMASSPAAAAWKAARFVRLLGRASHVYDLCCGIGADAMGLARAGLNVSAADICDVRAWMCAKNARCETRVTDVTDMELEPGVAVHIDPQRRSGVARRTPRLEDLEPSLEFARSFMEQKRPCCVKLFPGVRFDQLPAGEVELLSERSRLRQALLWTGLLAGACRTATLLDSGATLSGKPGAAPIGPIGAFVHTVDPAVERAELIGALAGQFGLTTPHASSGLLNADSAIDSPFLRPYRVLEELAWSLARARRVVRSLGGGIVAVKTRGKTVDPDRVQAQLRGKGERALVVFVLRFGAKVRCVICESVQHSELGMQDVQPQADGSV